ncbi:phosphoribosyltransferase [Sphingobium phenoxybenzoativorans]|uniref:phosphoribosyltransferase n=1 Tax=Sphingobium phenoxybenzoativorans TaxID=1592790 RepID=UPI0008722982|nr:phosphoribosyltransferase domain-containing protein [Sphingobium phenoxybenzoativorans]
MSSLGKPKLHPIPHEEFLKDIETLAAGIEQDSWRPDFVVGIGRGGLVPAVYLSHRLNLPMLSIDHSAGLPAFGADMVGGIAGRSGAGQKFLFVDDINDSGATIAHFRSALGGDGNVRFAVLISNRTSRAAVDYQAQAIDRTEDKRWFVFPWEAVGETETIMEEAQSLPERLA